MTNDSAPSSVQHRDLLRHNVLVATSSGGGGGGSGGGVGLGLGLGSSAGVGCGAEKMASWSAGRAVIADFGLACWLEEPYPGQGTPRARQRMVAVSFTPPRAGSLRSVKQSRPRGNYPTALAQRPTARGARSRAAASCDATTRSRLAVGESVIKCWYLPERAQQHCDRVQLCARS